VGGALQINVGYALGPGGSDLTLIRPEDCRIIAEGPADWRDVDRTLQLACTYDLETSPSYLLNTPWMDVDSEAVTLMDLAPISQLRLLKPAAEWNVDKESRSSQDIIAMAKRHLAHMASITHRIATSDTEARTPAPMTSKDLADAVLATVLSRMPESVMQGDRVTVMMPCPAWPLSAHVQVPFGRRNSRRFELLSEAESEAWTPLCEPVLRMWSNVPTTMTTVSYNGTVVSGVVASIGSDPMRSMRLIAMLDELSNRHRIEENDIEASCPPEPVDSSSHPS
jgi:hypothetical protein